MNIVVIGGGLFGQLITTVLKSEGHQVTILDSKKPGAGSPPAACVMNPDWGQGLGEGVFDRGLETVGEHFQVRSLKLKKFNPKSGTKEVLCYRVATYEILQRNTTVDFNVTGIPTRDGVTWKVSGDKRIDSLRSEYAEYRCDKVIVAAGCWCQELLRKYKLDITARGGSAYLFGPQDVPSNAMEFIRPWAPFKQVVGFHRGDGFWVGDGTAKQGFLPSDEAASRARCIAELKTDPAVTTVNVNPITLFGWRPYVRVKPCLLRELEPGMWVATGAAKNGTILGGWCASQLAEALR